MKEFKASFFFKVSLDGMGYEFKSWLKLLCFKILQINFKIKKSIKVKKGKKRKLKTTLERNY